MTSKQQSSRWHWTKSTVALELILLFAIAVIVFITSARFDVLERFVEFSRKHEHWELDELLSVSVFIVVGLGFFSKRRLKESHNAEMKLQQQNIQLEKAILEIKQLRGIIPICAKCKKIRDDVGSWQQIESYISEHTEAEFSHGVCPDCMNFLYPEYSKEDEKE